MLNSYQLVTILNLVDLLEEIHSRVWKFSMLQRSMAKCYADTITAYVVTGEREQILTLLTKLRAEPADRLTKQVISELTSIINED